MAASDLEHPSSRLALAAFCFALVGATAMVYYYAGLFIPRSMEVRAAKNLDAGYSFGNDFYQIWLASRAWQRERRDPYSPEMTREIQIGLYGRPLDPRLVSDPKDRRAFPYPAFTELLFWPAAQFPFPVVRIIVSCVLGLLTVATALLWMRALSWQLGWPWVAILILLVLCSYQVMEGLYAGQIGLLVSFLIAASILALQRGKMLLSGVLMALTTMKPQVTAFAILYLIVWTSQDWRRRGRFFLGLFVTGIALVGAALVVWPHWISSWVQVAVLYHGYTPPPIVTQVVTVPFGSDLARPVAWMVTIALVAASMVLIWRNRTAGADSLDFWLTLSTLFGITVIALLPGQAIYDHCILIPGVFLLILLRQRLSYSWISKAVRFAGVAVLLWPWLASLCLILVRPLLTHERFYSRAVFALPLRMAGVFPFVVLGLLVLLRRAQPAGAEKSWSLSG